MAAHHVAAGKARAAQFTSDTQRAAAQALIEQRGPEHMRAIGRIGAKTTHKRYKFRPIGTRGWAMVGRKDGQIVAVMDAPG